MGQTAVDLALEKVPLADEIKFKIIWRTGLTGNRFPTYSLIVVNRKRFH